MSTTTKAAVTSAPFNDADVTFAQGMVPHHEQAVEMAALASTQASSQEIKDIAARMKSAQDPEIEQMSAWLNTWDQPLEMAGSDSMATDGMMSEADMADLDGASSTEFDSMFLTMMIRHHQGAITMAETEVADGKNADAVELAKAIITAQKAELTEMQNILDAK